MSYHRYTDSEIDFLGQYAPTLSRAELSNVFNSKFGTNISVKSITNKCNSLGYFGKSERHTVGDEVVRSDGYVIVKVTNDNCVPKHKRWQLKQRVIYEKVYGELPKSYVVIFKDGNIRNFDIDNLAAIPRKVAMTMGGCGLFGSNKEITESGILCATLIAKLKEF